MVVPSSSCIACTTQLCVSGSLFVLVPAQSSRVNGTTKTKLFLQGTSKLHNEAVTVARMGPAWLFPAMADCPGFTKDSCEFQPHPGAAHAVCGTQGSNLKLVELSLWVQSSPPDCSRTGPLFPYRKSAKANTSQMLLSMLGSISLTFWRCFLILKWFNLCNVKLHGNILSDSGFLASDEIQSCNWFSFSNIKCND